MAEIPINVDDLPDEIPSVGVGEKIFDVKDFKEDEEAEDLVYIAVLQVNMPDADDHELQIWDRFNQNYPMGKKKLKDFAKACGIFSGPLRTDEIIGSSVRALVKSNTWKDKDTGEVREGSKIGKYLYDANA